MDATDDDRVTSDLPALTAHVVVTDLCLNNTGVPAVLDRLQSCLRSRSVSVSEIAAKRASVTDSPVIER